jgi:nucleotide-binding universal stress UspA family protein
LAAGFERAVSAFDLDAEVRLGEVETDEFDEELRRLSEDGVDLVVVGARVM